MENKHKNDKTARNELVIILHGYCHIIGLYSNAKNKVVKAT